MPFDFPMLQGLASMAPSFNIQAPPRLNMPLVNMNMLGGAPEPEDNITSLMNQLYNPQFGMQNQYNDLIGNYPERGNPSVMRRIGAALYGMGREDPLKAADQFTNYHYYQNLGDWNNKAKNLQMAADNERAQNINERQIAYQTAGRTLEERKIKEGERKNLATEADRTRLRDRQDRLANLAEYKAKNPNIQWRVVNGKLFALDPASGTPTDTGISGMSDMEKMQFTANAAMDRTVVAQEGATDRTAMTIQGAADRQQTGAWSVVEVDDPQNPGKKKTVQMNTITGAIRALPADFTGVKRIGTNSTGSGSDPNLVEGRARYLRGQEAKMKPEWSKYVTLGPNNTVMIQPPGIFSGPDKDTHKAISDFILGTSMPSNMGAPQRSSSPLTVNPPGNNTNAPMRKTQTHTSGAKRTLISTDGGKTWRPE